MNNKVSARSKKSFATLPSSILYLHLYARTHTIVNAILHIQYIKIFLQLCNKLMTIDRNIEEPYTQ